MMMIILDIKIVMATVQGLLMEMIITIVKWIWLDY